MIDNNGNVKWNYKLCNKNYCNLHKEHIIPGKFAYEKLVDMFAENNFYDIKNKNKAIKSIIEIINKLYCDLITNDECKCLDSKNLKLKDKMTNNWKWTDDPNLRLTAANIEMN